MLSMSHHGKHPSRSSKSSAAPDLVALSTSPSTSHHLISGALSLNLSNLAASSSSSSSTNSNSSGALLHTARETSSSSNSTNSNNNNSSSAHRHSVSNSDRRSASPSPTLQHTQSQKAIGTNGGGGGAPPASSSGVMLSQSTQCTSSPVVISKHVSKQPHPYRSMTSIDPGSSVPASSPSSSPSARRTAPRGDRGAAAGDPHGAHGGQPAEPRRPSSRESSAHLSSAPRHAATRGTRDDSSSESSGSYSGSSSSRERDRRRRKKHGGHGGDHGGGGGGGRSHPSRSSRRTSKRILSSSSSSDTSSSFSKSDDESGDSNRSRGGNRSGGASPMFEYASDEEPDRRKAASPSSSAASAAASLRQQVQYTPQPPPIPQASNRSHHHAAKDTKDSPRIGKDPNSAPPFGSPSQYIPPKDYVQPQQSQQAPAIPKLLSGERPRLERTTTPITPLCPQPIKPSLQEDTTLHKPVPQHDTTPKQPQPEVPAKQQQLDTVTKQLEISTPRQEQSNLPVKQLQSEISTPRLEQPNLTVKQLQAEIATPRQEQPNLPVKQLQSEISTPIQEQPKLLVKQLQPEISTPRQEQPNIPVKQPQSEISTPRQEQPNIPAKQLQIEIVTPIQEQPDVTMKHPDTTIAKPPQPEITPQPSQPELFPKTPQPEIAKQSQAKLAVTLSPINLSPSSSPIPSPVPSPSPPVPALVTSVAPNTLTNSPRPVQVSESQTISAPTVYTSTQMPALSSSTAVPTSPVLSAPTASPIVTHTIQIASIPHISCGSYYEGSDTSDEDSSSSGETAPPNKDLNEETALPEACNQSEQESSQNKTPDSTASLTSSDTSDIQSHPRSSLDEPSTTESQVKRHKIENDTALGEISLKSGQEENTPVNKEIPLPCADMPIAPLVEQSHADPPAKHGNQAEHSVPIQLLQVTKSTPALIPPSDSPSIRGRSHSYCDSYGKTVKNSSPTQTPRKPVSPNEPRSPISPRSPREQRSPRVENSRNRSASVCGEDQSGTLYSPLEHSIPMEISKKNGTTPSSNHKTTGATGTTRKHNEYSVSDNSGSSSDSGDVHTSKKTRHVHLRSELPMSHKQALRSTSPSHTHGRHSSQTQAVQQSFSVHIHHSRQRSGSPSVDTKRSSTPSPMGARSSSPLLGPVAPSVSSPKINTVFTTTGEIGPTYTHSPPHSPFSGTPEPPQELVYPPPAPPPPPPPPPPPKLKKTDIVTPFGKFKIGNILGQGVSAKVFRCLAPSGEFAAVKKFKKEYTKGSLKAIQDEVAILNRLDHPNIIKVIGVHEDNNRLYLFLEFAENGTLETVLEVFRLDESQVCVYVRQLVLALEYLHSHKIVHRDLKASNCLLSKAGTVKLADFGVSVVLQGDSSECVPAGSPYWMAPEVIMNECQNEFSDIWSLGITTIELLQGNPPFFDSTGMQAMFKIIQDDIPIPTECSPQLADFLKKCLNKDYSKRPTASQLLSHPWLSTHTVKLYDPEMAALVNSISIEQISINLFDANGVTPDTANTAVGATSSFAANYHTPYHDLLNNLKQATATILASLEKISNPPVPESKQKSTTKTKLEEDERIRAATPINEPTIDPQEPHHRRKSSGKLQTLAATKSSQRHSASNLIEVSYSAAGTPSTPSPKIESSASPSRITPDNSPVHSRTSSYERPVATSVFFPPAPEKVHRKLVTSAISGPSNSHGIKQIQTKLSDVMRKDHLRISNMPIRASLVSHLDPVVLRPGSKEHQILSMVVSKGVIWVAGNDGLVSLYHSQSFENMITICLHKTRILSMHQVKNSVFVSSEESAIWIVDETLHYRRYTVTDKDHYRITYIMSNSSQRGVSKRIWCCGVSSYSTQISILKKNGHVHSTFILPYVVHSMLLVGDNIWLACSRGVIRVYPAMNPAASSPVRTIDLAKSTSTPENPEYMLVVGLYVLVAMGSRIYVRSHEGKEIRQLEHSHTVTDLCLFQNLVLSGDSHGRIMCWAPMSHFEMLKQFSFPHHHQSSSTSGNPSASSSTQSTSSSIRALVALTWRDVPVFWAGNSNSELCVWKPR